MGKKDNAGAENIKVLVRCRPLSVKEKANKYNDCTEINLAAHCIGVKDNVSSRGGDDNVDWNNLQHRWTFDAVINHTFSQADIFSQFILPLVDSVLDGFNATVFAYGQSGSGKTHTMTGIIGDTEEEGIIPRCIKYIFNTIQTTAAVVTTTTTTNTNNNKTGKASRSHSAASSSSNNGGNGSPSNASSSTSSSGAAAAAISSPSAKLPNAQLMGEATTEPGKRFSLKVSFVELYNGKVRDLLALKQVPLDVHEQRDHTFFVSGCNLLPVTSPEEILRLMNEGTERRRTASTDLNDVSSRSHSLFTLYMECHEMTDEGTQRMVSSKLNLVDLAGSERQSKTNATGDTLKEGCNINLSLSALGTVIDTIVKGSPHIPYRSSPLTMLLKDSLGGNAKTIMFATISPSEHNISETISTLRFADRAKQIKNKPVVNMDIKDQKIFELSNLVHELKEKLARYETEGTQSLEQEAEQLRTRVCELEVTLDGMSKERMEDEEALGHVKQKYEKEREEIEQQCKALKEDVTEVRHKLQIAISEKDERKSALEEVFKVCAKYVNKGKTLKTVEELTIALKKFTAKMESSNSQRTQWEAQLESMKSEKAHIERELERIQKEMKEQADEHKTSLERSEEKAAKLMKELQESLNKVNEKKKGKSNKNNQDDTNSDSDDGDDTKDNKKSKKNRKNGKKQKQKSVVRSSSNEAEGDDDSEESEQEEEDDDVDDDGNANNNKRNKKAKNKNKNKKNSKNGFDSTLEENGETDSSTISGHDSRNTTGTSNGAGGLAGLTKPRNLKTAIIELEMMKSELAEVQMQRETASLARDKLNEELRLRREELMKMERRNNELVNEKNSLQNEFERKLAEVGNQSEELHFAEARLEKKASQVEEMRALLEEQKELIDKSNERAQEAQRKLDEVVKSSMRAEQYYKQLLQEKDEMFQSELNKRIAEFTAERQREADEKNNANVKKLKKKMKKLQEAMTELEKEYDVKVCECEELRSVLSDQKVSYFKLQQRVEKSDDEYELDDGKEQVRSALERAKQEQRRRSDMFNKGEIITPKVRPVKLPRMAKSARIMRNSMNSNSRISLNGTVSDGEYLNDFEDDDEDN